VLAGLILHPLDDAARVLARYSELAAQAPDELACWFVLRRAPPAPFVPAAFHGREVLVLAVCYSGDAREGERWINPIRALGRPIADLVAPQPYVAWQQVLDPLLQPGARNYWKSHNFTGLSEGLIAVLLEYARLLPGPETEIALAHLGGAAGRPSPLAMAYPHRDANYVLNVHTRWTDPAQDAACIAWARALFAAAAPFATGGAYVNFMSDDDERVRAAFGVNYDRMRALKAQYDPTNFFRLNQNVEPLATPPSPQRSMAPPPMGAPGR
jgi:FAD/FMN-containing dehydrogenase